MMSVRPIREGTGADNRQEEVPVCNLGIHEFQLHSRLVFAAAAAVVVASL